MTVATALARRERREWLMDAIPGRLDGHYPDVATRGRGHRHSPTSRAIFAAARGGCQLKGVFYSIRGVSDLPQHAQTLFSLGTVDL